MLCEYSSIALLAQIQDHFPAHLIPRGCTSRNNNGVVKQKKQTWVCSGNVSLWNWEKELGLQLELGPAQVLKMCVCSWQLLVIRILTKYKMPTRWISGLSVLFRAGQRCPPNPNWLQVLLCISLVLAKIFFFKGSNCMQRYGWIYCSLEWSSSKWARNVVALHSAVRLSLHAIPVFQQQMLARM